MREIALRWITPDDLNAHLLRYRLSEWLTGDELRLLGRLRSPRRRRDWLAGRLAAKELIQATHALPLREIEILPDAHGAPEPRCVNVALSIAHSAGHALAALGPAGRSVGVDLQQIRLVRGDLASRILSEREQRQLVALTPLLSPVVTYGRGGPAGRGEGLCIFWALKEAALKAWRTRPVPPLREIAVTLTESGHAEIQMRSRKLTARWGRWRDFIWAWAG
ncbi:MAG: 4'-phosphopantetheinyl transferase superfamily protein [Candidatus Bipolaricaulota bacterium]|nr:4'-phosphopantetheinyl transferase superfamily protein [Candidatus Bipolaricaulota bacterium]MCS7274201.1 4'-phosphopantetheinyl transferase superfamily protein [Candidatus Bipolaricaulota bacterium]MDW8110633.1 4'-phosphopantetheinyl transferase superfamily protein [Candidatus Bipolaricaulota bacterium]MDW8328509.1 4'-phosphopantetheinyl transferase superfamily protein [Candidatus Bipolaricaulota bacterium]